MMFLVGSPTEFSSMRRFCRLDSLMSYKHVRLTHAIFAAMGLSCICLLPSVAAAGAASCPSRKPEIFFEAFTKDQYVQRKLTDIPLLYQRSVKPGEASAVAKLFKVEDLPFFQGFGGKVAQHKGLDGAPDDIYLVTVT